MKKILYILYQPYKWLVVFPFMIGSTLFFGSLAVVLVALTSQRFAGKISGVWWARLNSYITPMLVKVIGKENIDKKQSYIIVSNHQSHYDVFVVYGWIGVDIKWVMKQELRSIPVFGYACEKVGFIYVDRSDKEAARASIEEAKKRITGGSSAIFFPEGTRSCTGEIGSFKKGAFRMAMDLGIPILPITVIGSRNILPAKSLRLFPGRVKMIIHKPIDVTTYSYDTIEDLMGNVKAVIQGGLDE